jgi:hypothetical protein
MTIIGFSHEGFDGITDSATSADATRTRRWCWRCVAEQDHKTIPTYRYYGTGSATDGPRIKAWYRCLACGNVTSEEE